MSGSSKNKTLKMLSELVVKETTYSAKVRMPEELLKAIEYIEENSEVSGNILILEGLKKR